MPVAVASAPALPSVPLKTVSNVLTSGQQDPEVADLATYEQFPTEITGRTVWTREDFVDNESLWKHFWSAEQLAALDASYEKFAALGLSLPEINRVSDIRWRLT
jgi:hypothetical protein